MLGHLAGLVLVAVLCPVLGSGITLSGRVVDEAGSPIEGAAVELLAEQSGFLQATSAGAALSLKPAPPE